MRPACATLLPTLLLLALLTQAAVGQRNVLLIVADDLGVDRVGAYGAHPDPGHTPVIDGLAAEGMLFRRCWSNPTCSPTRATILTGRYAHRTGVGHAFAYNGQQQPGLPADEVTLPQVLPPAYASWLVGKWHLATETNGGLDHALDVGFDHHLGTLGNLPGTTGGDGYWVHDKLVDGVLERSATYATTEQVDDALALIAAADGPWFLWLAFNAPHSPFHAPPQALHSYDLPADVGSDIPMAMKAMTEAMDTEIGRLLAGIDPAVLADTVIVFVGDNGTASPATTAPQDPAHAKGTVYQGGVHVPLIVKGPQVAPGTQCNALVNTTDLFATIAELAGAGPVSAEDSVSMVPYFSAPGLPPLRAHVYAEWFEPNGPGPGPTLERLRAARTNRFKLLATSEHPTAATQFQFFDLIGDPLETHDLLLDGPLPPGVQQVFSSLQQVLDDLDGQQPWTDLGGALPGGAGEPSLTGGGSLLAGEPYALLLVDAWPLTGGYLVVGSQAESLPFKGGVMIPRPEVTHSFETNVLGEWWASSSSPPGLLPDLPLYWQCWIFDPTTAQKASASNGLFVSTPGIP